MKVLHLSGSKHHWSGNEQQLADLIHNLLPLKVESNIFCYEGAAIETYAQQNDIPTFPQERMSIYSPVLAKRLKDCIRRNNIDVVHAHTSNFLTVYMVADLLFGLHIPTVFSRKGFSEKSSFVSRLKYNYKGIDAVICGSIAVKKGMKHLLNEKNYAQKIHVIYDGISITSEAHIDREELCEQFDIAPKKYVIGNIANHVDAKDLPTLIETLNYIVNDLSRKDIHLVQIGAQTALTPLIEEKVRQYCLNDFITFAGKIENAKRYIPAFDAILMSSKSEGLPLVIYESFLNRVPVVSTNAGGIAEVIFQDDTGLISDVGDSVTLAENMNKLLSEESLQESIKENAYKLFINGFTAQKSAENTKQLYETFV